jgi:hypothetical protein
MHLLARIALCLLVGLPTLGIAQTADAPVASREVQTPPPLISVPSKPEPPPSRGELIPRMRPEEDRPNLIVPRLLLGSVLGTAAGAAGGVLGLLISYHFEWCDEGIESSCDNELATAVVTLAGIHTFSSLTVYGMGSLLGGRGTLGATLLGGVVGMAVSILPVAVIRFGVLAIQPLTTLGALIAYEISDSHWEPEPEQTASANSGFQLMPVFSVTQGGGILGGLTGRF